jgi:hypothetical protein
MTQSQVRVSFSNLLAYSSNPFYYTVNSVTLVYTGLDMCWIIRHSRLADSTYTHLSSYIKFFVKKVKGKVIPLQARCGTEGG